MIEPGLCTVVTYTPSGTRPWVLNNLAHLQQVTYSFANPGGPDQFSCLMQHSPTWRHEALNPGRIVKVFRGGDVVWDGKLQEPSPSSDGWTVTGVGVGDAGADFVAIYTSTWGSGGSQNDAVNQAITRGLRWTNPGIPSGVWFGQPVDSGAQTITDLLNLFCTKGGYTWQVKTVPNGQPGSNKNVLTVYSFPAANDSTATMALASAVPVPRTLGGDVNTIFGRYQSSLDGASAATYGIEQATTAGAAALHGVLEQYTDLSSVGQLSGSATLAALNSILARYQRASFGGPFTVRYGELMTLGGQPVDIGLDYTGQVVQLYLTDFGYGGELVPDPVYFMIGAYSYDDATVTAQITPFQSLDLSISGLLSMLGSTLVGNTTPAPTPGTGTTPTPVPNPVSSHIPLPLKLPKPKPKKKAKPIPKHISIPPRRKPNPPRRFPE